MPKYRITAPDGSVYNIEGPEGATRAQLVGKIRDEYGLSLRGLLNQAKNTSNTWTRTAGGIVKGGAELLDSAAALLATPFGQRKQTLARPGFRSVVRGLPTNKTGEFIGNTGLTALLTAPVGGPATQGALAGLLNSKAESAGGLARDAVIGGVSGKVADVGTKFTSRLIAPVVDKSAQALRASGVKGITPGQALGGGAKVLEEKLTSYPFVGPAIKSNQRAGIESMNRTAVNRTLAPIGEALPDNIATGRDAVKWAGDKLGDAFDAITPQIQLRPDAQLATDVAGWAQNVARSGELSPQSVAKVEKVIDDVVTSRMTGTNVDGQTFRQVDERLGDLVRRYNSGGPEEQAMADAFSDMQDILHAGVSRTNPQVGARLRDIKEGWANLVRVEGAAGMGRGGIATPGQLATAVKRADTSVRKRAVSRGEALMGDFADNAVDTLAPVYPDSGTSGRTALDITDARFWAGLGLRPFYGPSQQKLITDLLMAPRPQAARTVADLFRNLPAASIGGAQGPALLSGR